MAAITGNSEIVDFLLSCHSDENKDLYFIGFSRLKRIKIPPNITRIDPNTFLSNHSLRYLSIPPSATYIGGNAFEDC